jgi:hypothetical protein
MNSGIANMINRLNQRIFNEFIKSIAPINVPSNFNLLTQFIHLVNVSNITAKVEEIETDLKAVQTFFINASASVPILSHTAVQTTINEVGSYELQKLNYY